MKRLKQLFDVKQMMYRCTQSEDSFGKLATEIYNGPHGSAYYIDRGSPILAIAHLDSVSNDNRFVTVESENDMFIFNRALDDRLGVYIILDLLPKLGITPDILLTTGEEIGLSTGSSFRPENVKWNWMFQFDRAGCDVVCYQYETGELKDRIEDIGFTVNQGLFTDISDMEHLGIKGINFGCGYYENHGPTSHMILSDLLFMVYLFIKFWKKWENVLMEHKEVYRDSYHSLYPNEWDNVEWPDDGDNYDWEYYTITYADLVEQKMPFERAHHIALAASRLDDRHLINTIDDYGHETESMMCPQCGWDYTPDEDPVLWELGMCENCYETYLNMELDHEDRLHEMSNTEWTESQYRELEEYDNI